MMVVMAARRGRPTAAVELSGEERQTLERWARRPCTTQSLAMRTRIVLACAEGKTNQAVAREVDRRREGVQVAWSLPARSSAGVGR